MPDMLSLASAAVHGSPADIADWTITAEITALTMSPQTGLSFSLPAPLPDRWDYHMPGWGDGKTDKGNLLYTVWAVVHVNGGWHTAAFIQMWRGRDATGAPILSDFHKNWAYARDRWGDVYDYQPQPGDTMGFFLSAGNARDERGVTSVRERTNVVTVTLPAGDRGSFNFAHFDVPAPPVVVPPVIVAPPVVVPAPVPAPSPDLAAILAKLDMLSFKLDAALAAKPTAPTYECATFFGKLTITPKP